MTALIPPYWLVIAAGAFGLLIGSFLNVVVWRVPRGESLLPASHCPHCDAPIRSWQNVPVISWVALGGRCASCRERISARYPLVELGTGAAFALVAWWWVSFVGGPLPAVDATQHVPTIVAWWLALGAYLWFAAAGVALTLIDLDHQRLPNAIVLPGLAVVISLLVASAILSGEWSRAGSTIAAAAALFALYFVIALVYPSGIGGGDVKLAPLVGGALGFIGWGAVAVGAFAGFLLGAVFGLALIALRRATRKSGIPFGPFMLVGAWIGIAWGQPLMGAYLSLFGLG